MPRSRTNRNHRKPPASRRLAFDALEPRILLTGEGVVVGTVIDDVDGDNLWDHDESALVGWRVYYDANENEVFDDGERFALSDATGAYRLDCLPLDVLMEIRVETQSGYESTGGNEPVVRLRETSSEATRDFRRRQSNARGTGRVGGYVFFDHNQDGKRLSFPSQRETTPAGSAGRSVFVDFNNNGTRDSGEPHTTSSASGRYIITNVPRGDQIVRVEAASGWTETSESFQSVFVGNQDAVADFGSYSTTFEPSYPEETARAYGVVWHDLNGNSGRNGGEPNLPGWKVFADLNANLVHDPDEPSSITDEFGVYRLDAPIGLRSIMVEMQPGFAASGNRFGAPVKIANFSRNAEGVSCCTSSPHFGVFESATVTGIIFDDVNGNEIQDAGETGMGGWRVFVTPAGSANGETSQYYPTSPNTVTAADGSYELEIPAIDRRKIKAVPDDPTGPLQLYDDDRSDRTVSLSPGESTTVDLGRTIGKDLLLDAFELENRVHGSTVAGPLTFTHTSEGTLIGSRFSSIRMVVDDGQLVFRSVFDGNLTPAYWNITPNDDGSLTFQNVASGLYLDGDRVTGDSTGLGLSTAAGLDDGWYLNPVNYHTRFGTLGDYGQAGSVAEQIAETFGYANPNLIVGLGDGRYRGNSFDDVHGLYCQYLQGVQAGPNCPSGGDSTFNRFFPAAGNHDYTDEGGIEEYLDYFNLPGAVLRTSDNPTGSELYYDFQYGPVHFFIIDSQAIKHDPVQAATQQQWLADTVPDSDAEWQIVVSHHSPYSSGSTHGPDPDLQFPYADWGVDMVMSSHEHNYERLEIDGVTYVVNGLGGRSRYNFGDPLPGSQIRFNDADGGMMFESHSLWLRGGFLTADGNQIDEFRIRKNVPLGLARVTAEAGANRTSRVGAATMLDGDFTYTDESREVYTEWTLTRRPAGSVAEPFNANMPVASFVPDIAGTYEFEFSVTNNSVEASDTVVVTVLEGDTVEQGVWTLRNRVHNLRVLTESADFNAELQPTGAAGVWLVSENGGGVVLKNRNTGRYLAAESFEAFTVDVVTDNARWSVVDNADGSIALQNLSTGRYLDADGANEDWNVDESIAIGADDGWFVETTPEVTEIWTLRNRRFSDRFMAEENNNALTTRMVGLISQWEVEYDPGGIHLKNRATGNYLAAADYEGFTVSQPGDETLFIVVENDDGSIGLQNSFTGRYLDADGAGASWDVDESNELLFDDGWFVNRLDDFEIWSLENRHYDGRFLAANDLDSAYMSTESEASTSQWIATMNGGAIVLTNQDTGLYLAADGLYEVEMTSNGDTDAVRWSIVQNDDSSIGLRNVASGHYLDGDGAGSGFGVSQSVELLSDDGWFLNIVSEASPNGSSNERSPLDILLIINELSERTVTSSETSELIGFHSDDLRLDLNDDARVTPLDALIGINELNAAAENPAPASGDAARNLPGAVVPIQSKPNTETEEEQRLRLIDAVFVDSIAD